MAEQALVPVTQLTSLVAVAPPHTALHRAAMVGNNDSIAALIQGGCAVDLQDRDGNTALHEASWHGFSQCVKLLVKTGADLHVKNKAGNTPLHLASQNAHAQAARLLLLGGATPDTRNIVGDTCLHVAARYNNVTMVKLLLSSLCSVTLKNQRGDTALHVAAALNHKKTVQLLLEAGADGTIRNHAGKTSLDKARDHNHKEVALLLARAPQVHRFMRGRTIRKRRDRLTAEHRTQSASRLELDSCSLMGERSGSDHNDSTVVQVGRSQHQQPPRRLQRFCHEAPDTISSPYSYPKKKRARDQPPNTEDVRKGKSTAHIRNDPMLDALNPQNGNAYQLYTLYRDKDGVIRQAPASGCHCKPLIRKLEGQVKATQEEMRLHILNMQEQVDSRLGKMDRRNRHQIKVLDMLNQERAAEERRSMLCRIEQGIAHNREEAMMSQAAVSQDLKRWCMSQLKNAPSKAQYYKLFPSPSVEQSDAELETLPLLSVVPGESSTSLANYVNLAPSKSRQSLGEQEKSSSRKYFEMKVDRSPDDYENTALFPLPANLLDSEDPCWQPPVLQEAPEAAAAAVVPLRGEAFSSSSSSSLSTMSEQQKRQSSEMVSVHGLARIHTDRTRTLEFYIDRPAEPTFNQERNNLHAMEVTQRFFETVSVQLERWYERKILEVQQQTELRVQKDRSELLQRISMLEEELQGLKTDDSV